MRINVDEDTGAISLTPTSDDVTSGSKRRSLLETSSSGVETIAQTADGSQVSSAHLELRIAGITRLKTVDAKPKP